jgi:hypothetical protein
VSSPRQSLSCRALGLALLLAAVGVLVLAGTPPSAPASETLHPHWYHHAGGLPGAETRLPEGEPVSINSYGYVELKTIRGTTGNYIRCNAIDSDGTVENPRGGGAGIQTITSFSASECLQTGYCRGEEKPELLIKRLPLSSEMFTKTNFYRFEHMKIGFILRCSGHVAANIVGHELLPYLSDGRYQVKAAPSLDFEDGGHFGSQYGNTGNLELENSGGRQIIQPKAYLSYIGYRRFANRVITSQTP